MHSSNLVLSVSNIINSTVRPKHFPIALSFNHLQKKSHPIFSMVPSTLKSISSNLFLRNLKEHVTVTQVKSVWEVANLTYLRCYGLNWLAKLVRGIHRSYIIVSEEVLRPSCYKPFYSHRVTENLKIFVFSRGY